ncbi:hypothetical protein A1Q2_06791 [Trichosporon asahii var. asahii CBS 8904]|uniref:Uncharacterized protein n=1 Tax=Trichosporon asahii var. asahii (strain CBS 8904) TaxID=1220162 RepID=K1VQL5_TRIAC|nr:hypothetical protein A1Q2_06791 [Trichosporon asahii var. asahii CBS 8904]
MSFEARPRSFSGGAAILPDLPYATEPTTITPTPQQQQQQQAQQVQQVHQALLLQQAQQLQQQQQQQQQQHMTHQRKLSAPSPRQSPRLRQHALPAFTSISGAQDGPHPPVLSSIKLAQLGDGRNSKSAPSSPMGKPQTAGLSPLTTIQPLDIGLQAHTGLPASPSQQLPPQSQSHLPNGHGPLHSNTFPPPLQQQQRFVDPRLLHAPNQVAGNVNVSPEIALRGLAAGQPVVPPNAQPGGVMRFPMGAHGGAGANGAGGGRGMSHPQPSVPSVQARRPVAPMAPRISSQASNASSDDTEVDSDSTFVPGRIRAQQNRSRSQPDLQALRSKAVERWATQQDQERRREAARTEGNVVRRRSQGRKTPPIRAQTLTTPLNAYSSARYSPRQPAPHLSPLTTWTPGSGTGGSSSQESSDAESPVLHSPPGGMTGSEDADDDLDGDSPSSGSISFSPRARRRQRSLPIGPPRSAAALGLVFDSTHSEEDSPRIVDIRAASIEARFQRSSLIGLRLLAVVPALWGCAVLAHALCTGYLWEDPWPWGVDFSREQLDRLVQGNITEGVKRPVHRGDMLLAMIWVSSLFCPS